MVSFSKNEIYTMFQYDKNTLAQLDGNQLKLLLTLAIKADPGFNYTCSPTQEELAEILCWSRSTVQTVMSSLLDVMIDGKYIVTMQKQVRQGGGYYNVYSVNCFK